MTSVSKMTKLTSLNDANFNYLDRLDGNEFKFSIGGVNCQNCLTKIYSFRENTPGLIKLNVNMGRKQMDLQFDPQKTRLSQVIFGIEKLGFKISLIESENEAEKIHILENKKALTRIAVAAVSSGNIMLLATAVYVGASSEYIPLLDGLSFLLFLPIIIYSASPYWKSFYKFITRGEISIDLTIITAILLGTFFSSYNLFYGHGQVYFDSMAMLVLLLLSSRYLLDRIQQKYLDTQSLHPYLFEKSLKIWSESDSRFIETPISKVQSHQKALTYQDQWLSFDGVLNSQECYVNTMVLTGETHPIKIEKGHKVFAGTQILSENAEFEILTLGEQTRIGKLLNEISRNVQNDSHLTKKLQVIAKFFTSFILLSAAVLLVYFGTTDLQVGIERALALSLLACPCALALAIPLTQSLSIMQASRKGIVIKDANVLSLMSQIKHIGIDKTGTLTEGSFELLNPQIFDNMTEIEINLVYSLEKIARHPIGKGLVKALEENKKVSLSGNFKVQNRKEVFGTGVIGTYENDVYEIKQAKKNEFHLNTSSVAGFYKNGALIHTFELGDPVRTESIPLINELKSKFTLHLLSGDNSTTVAQVADTLNWPNKNIIGEMSPEQKVKYVENTEHLLMLGDGANDAVALSKSTVGIAVSGSMAASLKVAPVYFTKSGLLPILDFIEICNRFEITVRGHLWFSGCYNLVGTTLAVLGYINPLVAALLMPASSLTVLYTTLRGLRILTNTKSDPLKHFSRSRLKE